MFLKNPHWNFLTESVSKFIKLHLGKTKAFFSIHLLEGTTGDAQVNQSGSPITKGNPSGRHTGGATTFEEKQRQLMLADCKRLIKRMTIVKNSIDRPPL